MRFLSVGLLGLLLLLILSQSPRASADPDIGLTLVPFAPNELFLDAIPFGFGNGGILGETIYLDSDFSVTVTAGDIRLANAAFLGPFADGSIVIAADADVAIALSFFGPTVMHEDSITNGVFNVGETVYLDGDSSGSVTAGDTRLANAGSQGFADGSVVIPTGTTGTLIIATDTTLTEDHLGRIIIDADSISLDCAGHAVTGSGSGSGISLDGRTGVTVKNCNVTNFFTGIRLLSSSDNTIKDNTASGNTNGFFLTSSSNNAIKDNTASGNDGNGFGLLSSSSNTFEGNTAAVNDDRGFVLTTSSNNILENNRVENNGLSNVLLVTCNGNAIRSNIFLGANNGIWLTNSAGNIIEQNDISSATVFGIALFNSASSNSADNTIFHNNIIDNNVQAFDNNPLLANNWHHPILLEGNFWSDYPGLDDGSGAGKHAIAGDGIGDTDVPWPGTNFDNYPFIEEDGWEAPEPPIDARVPEFGLEAVLMIAILAPVLLFLMRRTKS